MRILCVLFGAAVAAALFSGCGSSSSSPTSPGGNPVGGAPTIHATVDWSVVQTKLLQSIGIPVETTVTATVNVYTGTNVQDTAAVVSLVLNGASYPLSWDPYGIRFTTTSATHKVPASAVKNGDQVTVTVTSGGTTYTESATMPGGVTVADDGSSASWLTEGNFDELTVFALDANNMPITSPFVASSTDGSGGMTVTEDLNSPVSIPQGGMTSGKSYEIEVLAQEVTTSFGSAANLSDLSAREIYLKDITK
ncbi:MAG TPA: hypothetical protein VLX68_07015 [Chitinivibrionales bacterium]|nr:hypothetical protein [Chitinivibrionales bacterium]